ncbi:MAG: Rieske (2Fe-2S) protein [Candidatus Rokuibacteriota bacterium]
MPFVKIADVDEIAPGQGTLIERDGLALAVFNAGGGRFYAVSPVCPHEDGPLAEGWLEGDTVVCPWHGFNFDLTTGVCPVDEDLTVAAYRVRVVGSAVEVELP